MAKLTNSSTEESKELPDGSEIRDTAEELGVPFGCRDGICGTCMIDIKKGADNLTELTEEEHDMMRDKEHRLACQCRIKSGEVVFDM